MSRLHLVHRSVNLISPYCRNVNASSTNALKQILAGGRSQSHQSPHIGIGIGTSRNLHISSVKAATSTISTSVGTSSSLPEINIEAIRSAGQAAPQIESSSLGITSGITPEMPASHVGFIFSDSPPVLVFRDMLCQIQDIPGMEWSTTIILTTIGLRVLVGLPITITQQRSVEKLQSLQPEVKQLAENLARETAIAVKLYNWNKRKANNVFKKSFKKHWKALMETHNCHPMRAVALGLLQVPFWVALSGAIRNVAFCLPNPATDEMLARWSQIAAESTPWVDSLTATDPVVFPLIFLVSSLANIQINAIRKLSVPQTKLQIAIPWILRVAVTGIAVFAMFTPSAVTMYWATSSLLALLLNLFLRINRVRRFFGLLPRTI